MKTLVIILAGIIMFIFVRSSLKVNLVKLEGPEVSNYAKKNFKNEYGKSDSVNWQRTTYFDKATFSKDGHLMNAFYDHDGFLVGTTTTKYFEDLPAKAREKIKDDYKNYTINELIYFDDSEDNETNMVLYNQEFDDTDSFFITLNKGNEKIVLQISPGGDVSFFTRIS